MKIPQEWLPTVRRLHHDLVSGNAPDHFGLSASASTTSTLPLSVDMGGFYGIGMDGEVLSFIWDKLDCPIEVEKQWLYNAVLFQGSKFYPELLPLVPSRPYDAVDCSYCDGTGIVSDFPGLEDRIVCFCGGVGWIPAEK